MIRLWLCFLKVLYVFRNHTDIFIDFWCLICASNKYRSYVDSDIEVMRLLFSLSVVSDSLQPYGLQHARLPCPSPFPGACSNSCPLSREAIQLSHPQSSPSPPAFNLPQHHGLFQWVSSSTSGGQSTGASALASVLPMNIQNLFPLWLTGLISLLPKALSRVLSSTKIWKHPFFAIQPSLWSNSHICTWLLKKTIALTVWTFVSKVMSLLFNVLLGIVVIYNTTAEIREC